MKNLLLLAACLFVASAVRAQLPNEKFGKPSDMEWEFQGWGDALQADALVLCKAMTVTYQLSDQVVNFNQSGTDIGAYNITDFSKNKIDESSILVKYQCRLRTKILKPEGARHANIDITYYDPDKRADYNGDALSALKVRVFTRNEKGKVQKRTVDADTFVRERVEDNYMVLHVAVPDVQPGSIIEYQYDITSNRAPFLYDWVFQDSIPVLRSHCDIDIPAILQFNMNVPIHKRIKSSVEVGRLAYDTNRPDLKKGKTCPTNHYRITGDYILPSDTEIARFTSKILSPPVTPPAYLPKGCTHLRIK